ncbi:MAG: hypothetical protein KAY24_14400, partial [Candidatus Eisenbacteria sp.]|nr:hypothetical protein [Candidatus Eisenbacteria bacterium]
MFGSSRFALACVCVICLGWLMALPASAELTTAEEIFGAALDHLNNGTSTVQMVNGWCEVSWDYPKA